MKEKLSAYRITWLLYLGVLILPLIFYYTYTQMRSLESSSSVVRELGRSGGNMLSIAVNDPGKVKIKAIDKSLEGMKRWFLIHDADRFYTGTKSPLKDYEDLKVCWSELKKDKSRQKALECWKKASSLAFIVERMSTLQQERIKNLLYMNTAAAMAFLLLLIYFIRSTIKKKIKHGEEKDRDTGLYNKKYCEIVTKEYCTDADKVNLPLSAIYIKIDKPEEFTGQFLRSAGACLIAETRASDIPCRYGEREFLLLLPNTPEDGGDIALERIGSNVVRDMKIHYEDFDAEIHRITKKKNESAAEFLKRAVTLQSRG